MPNIDLLKENRDINNLTSLFIRSLPEGYLYNDSLSDLAKGFVEAYQDFLLTFEKSINDLFYIDETNIFLDEYKVMYGLPNPLFPDIQTKEQAVLAISMMKLSQTLISKEDYENFMLLLGFNVKFYKINANILENATFPYNFPITFSPSTTRKDKLTYWIYVEDSGDNIDPFYNLGDAFPVEFVQSQNNLQQVKKILDFLKPDYLIFKYITLYTKNLYGLN